MIGSILQTVRKSIVLQAAGILELEKYINSQFAEAVSLIHQSTGRLVITGIGKTAIVAQKIVSTLNSTGTASLFMHAADAIHGDLGMIQKNDIVTVISKSGESPEIKTLVPLIKNFGNTIIAITGNTRSHLARHANFVLNTTVNQEACINNLAPTTSTTAQMVMGDSLAIALMELKRFTREEFARYHPGGSLGRQLTLKVRDLCHLQSPPVVIEEALLKEVIVEMTSKMLGVTAVINKEGKLRGIITDGDLRRMLENNTDSLSSITAKEICTPKPKTIDANELAATAFGLMQSHSITQLLVTQNDDSYVGVLHLHTLIKEGIF